MNKADIIQHFIDKVNAKTYLEIGVRHGETFSVIKCDHKVGVDPKFVNLEYWDSGIPFSMTSDEYFEKYAEDIDVAFIDGLHTFEQSFRDAINCLKWLRNGGVIILHDCNPTNKDWTIPGLSDDFTGDVWKTVVALRTFSNLYVFTIDCDFGVAVVMRGIPKSVVDLSMEDIERMEFEDLDKDRKTLLNLVSVDEFLCLQK